MARVYRPYLNLLYMTNAYHFYSPDPGTSSVMWFAVYYDDGTFDWITGAGQEGLSDRHDLPAAERPART